MGNGPSSVLSLCRSSKMGLPPGSPNLQAGMRCAGGTSEPRERKEASYVLKLKQGTVNKTRLLSIYFLNTLLGNHKHHTSHTHTHTHSVIQPHTENCSDIQAHPPSEIQLHRAASVIQFLHTQTYAHTLATFMYTIQQTTAQTPSQPYTTPLCK